MRTEIADIALSQFLKQNRCLVISTIGVLKSGEERLETRNTIAIASIWSAAYVVMVFSFTQKLIYLITNVLINAFFHSFLCMLRRCFGRGFDHAKCSNFSFLFFIRTFWQMPFAIHYDHSSPSPCRTLPWQVFAMCLLYFICYATIWRRKLSRK